ncbi:MAG: hypothetical protein OXU33_13745 [Gemmatimonadota bacterium]|nr:hypothetical protein [Gemmatimonadota bacterium]MDE3015126.1 hypothetical protein [Gemmatimonadota bacterium]
MTIEDDEIPDSIVMAITESLRACAYHEAGHAVVATALGRDVLFTATSSERPDEGGRTEYADGPTPEELREAPEHYRAIALTSLAGPAAEARFRLRDRGLEDALTSMVVYESPLDAAQVELYIRTAVPSDAAWETEVTLRRDAFVLVLQYWSLIQGVAEELVVRGRLSGEEIGRLMGGDEPAATPEARGEV